VLPSAKSLGGDGLFERQLAGRRCWLRCSSEKSRERAHRGWGVRWGWGGEGGYNKVEIYKLDQTGDIWEEKKAPSRSRGSDFPVLDEFGNQCRQRKS
jgi:hypothetical protein